jgi:hypothetical protein
MEACRYLVHSVYLYRDDDGQASMESVHQLRDGVVSYCMPRDPAGLPESCVRGARNVPQHVFAARSHEATGYYLIVIAPICVCPVWCERVGTHGIQCETVNSVVSYG